MLSTLLKAAIIRKNIFKKPLICVICYIFTCRRSPAYSSSICLIEKNPEIVEHAVLKKKKMYLLIHQLYLLHQKCFLNIGQLKQNREMVL